MTEAEFEDLVAEEFPSAVPTEFRDRIKNLGFVIESEPSAEVRKNLGLRQNETLLGLYRGIPLPVRGEYYGVGGTVPDVITLYRNPILESAQHKNIDIRKVIRETIWHEVAHHFGLSDKAIASRVKEKRLRKSS